MAKAAGGNAEKLSALIAEIEADAYARGRADAKKELMDLLQSGDLRTSGARAALGKAAGKKASTGKRTGQGKRAPRGSVRPFVERALGEYPGATAPEILGHASNDVERSIKLSSIRVELRNGRLRGRYVSDDGRWSLAVSAARDEAASPEPPPDSAAGTGEAASGLPTDAGDAAAPEANDGESGTTLGLNF